MLFGDSFSYILDSMQKLKRAYPELQSDAKSNFDKVTMERARMLYAYANK